MWKKGVMKVCGLEYLREQTFQVLPKRIWTLKGQHFSLSIIRYADSVQILPVLVKWKAMKFFSYSADKVYSNFEGLRCFSLKIILMFCD